MAEDRTRWMADLLATSLQVSGLSEEELELRLGWTSGSVARLLEGEGDLDPQETLRVLAELNAGLDRGPEPEDRDDGQTQVVTNLLDRFHRLGYDTREVSPPDEALDIQKLEKQVQVILRQAFGEKD